MNLIRASKSIRIALFVLGGTVLVGSSAAAQSSTGGGCCRKRGDLLKEADKQEKERKEKERVRQELEKLKREMLKRTRPPAPLFGKPAVDQNSGLVPFRSGILDGPGGVGPTTINIVSDPNFFQPHGHPSDGRNFSSHMGMRGFPGGRR